MTEKSEFCKDMHIVHLRSTPPNMLSPVPAMTIIRSLTVIPA